MGTTRQQVGKHFLAVERPALQPLPLTRFPFFHEGQRTVNRDGHIEVDHAYYSVPPEHLGQRVWVRWDGRLVRIFTARMEAITVHMQRSAGQFSTDRKHLAAEKISVVEHGATYLLTRFAAWDMTRPAGRKRSSRPAGSKGFACCKDYGASGRQELP